MNLQTQNTENKGVTDFILSCLTSTEEERRQCKIEIERWENSRLLGEQLCKEINKRLEDNNGLELTSGLEDYYSDDVFSFEASKYRDDEDLDRFNVWIRIKARNNDGVQPNLLNAVALFEIDGRTKELKLDVRGEGILKNLEPDAVYCFKSLTAATDIDDTPSRGTVTQDGSIPGTTTIQRTVAWYDAEGANVLVTRIQNTIYPPVHRAASLKKKKTCYFNIEDVRLEATIEEDPCGCWVVLKADSAAVFQKKNACLVFVVPNSNRAGFGNFEFQQKGDSFVASASLDLEYDDNIEPYSEDV